MDEKETWQAALGELEVILSRPNFQTWFRDTFILELADEEIIIGVPHCFAKDWLENKFYPDILKTLQKLHPGIKTFKCTISTSSEKPIIKNEPKKEIINAPEYPSFSAPTLTEIKNSPTINSKYTFVNYIVGNSNRLAAATAQAVATNPGVAYNPLFIYGGVGLGKTHLVQAIGNEIIANNPKKKIIYVSCEKFTNDYIASIQNKKTNDFKKMYRDADVLMVDDIQFMSGKDGTQEEFFHTFNALHQTNRQIVITSDRVPKAIPQLAERLSSRFGMGMVADIQPPNIEMRQAILRAKCDEKKCLLDEDILDYIAENIESNIRELEGAVIKVLSFAELSGVRPSLDLAQKALSDIITSREKNLSVEKVFQIASEFFNIETSDILSAKRNKELVRPRQIIMYLLRHEMNLSFPNIGKKLNKKDHTTIIHGVKKIEKEIARNEELSKELSTLKEKLHK